MGIGLDARCACGFREEIWVDRGKVAAEPLCLAPALCADCKRMVSANYADKTPRCPRCKGSLLTFYNDASLQKNPRARKDISWGMDLKGEFVLPRTTFTCPQCGNTTLTFTRVANWD